MTFVEIFTNIPSDIRAIFSGIHLLPSESDLKLVTNKRPFTIIVLGFILLSFCAMFMLFLAPYAMLTRSIARRISVRIKNELFSNIFVRIMELLAFIIIFVPIVKAMRWGAENQEYINELSGEYADLIAVYPLSSSAICFILGFFAYLIRCRARLIYAVLELIVGIFASFSTSGFQDPNGAIQFLGGIYIIVRAFDNMNKGFEQRKWTDGFWSGIFGSRR